MVTKRGERDGAYKHTHTRKKALVNSKQRKPLALFSGKGCLLRRKGWGREANTGATWRRAFTQCIRKCTFDAHGERARAKSKRARRRQTPGKVCCRWVGVCNRNNHKVRNSDGIRAASLDEAPHTHTHTLVVVISASRKRKRGEEGRRMKKKGSHRGSGRDDD